jgi:hypothetical protein
MRLPFVPAAVAALAAAVLALPARAQLPADVDSVLTLNRAGRFETAVAHARARLGAAAGASTGYRCQLRAALVWAESRLPARRDSALAALRAWDAECADATYPGAAAYAREVERARDGVAAPPLPAGGVDVSAVHEFFVVADTLARDVEPSAALWRRFLRAPGNRLYGRGAQLRELMTLALMPSRAARRDSLAAASPSATFGVRYLQSAFARRAELTRFVDSLARADLTSGPTTQAAAFLPAGATRGRAAPLVAFALFGPDGYAQDGGIVIDAAHARALGAGLPLMVAHELHHHFLGELQTVRLANTSTNDGAVVRALFQLRNEGIADLVDKPHPLPADLPGPEGYVARYNAAYADAPNTLRALDTLLLALATDTVPDPARVRRLFAALPFGGHPTGGYMARRIHETFGVDSLMPGVASQFAFVRAYAAAERARGAPVPLSEPTLAALGALERKYRRGPVPNEAR